MDRQLSPGETGLDFWKDVGMRGGNLDCPNWRQMHLILGDADSQCFPENQGLLNSLQLGNLIWRKLKSFITSDSFAQSNLLMEAQTPLRYSGTELFILLSVQPVS